MTAKNFITNTTNRLKCLGKEINDLKQSITDNYNNAIQYVTANFIPKDDGVTYDTNNLKTMTEAEYNASPKTAGTLYFTPQP